MKTGSLKTNYLKDLTRFDSSLRSKIRDLRKDLLVSSPFSSVIGINKPLQAHTESEKYKTDVPGTGNIRNPFLSGCFYWMIPNLYTKNCCFIKHPLNLVVSGTKTCETIADPWWKILSGAIHRSFSNDPRDRWGELLFFTDYVKII